MKENIKLSLKPYKGTRDFYPEDMDFRNWMFNKFKEVLNKYNYREYNGPLLEPFDLYAAKSGIELVSEQTYNFEDKGGRHLAVRPEMTPTVSRMIAAKANELNFPVRWFSIANFHRYEKPQKGRLREHYQVNVDVFGSPSMRADAEILSLAIKSLENYGADSSMFKIRINNRRFFNDVLNEITNLPEEKHIDLSKIIDRKEKISEEDYLEELRELGLNNESIKRLNDVFKMSLEDAIKICENSKGTNEIKQLFDLIKEMGLEKYCEFDFSIVRGLDYYTGTVFEVYDKSTENKRALFGGGRYDNLVNLFGIKNQIPGVGFGCGDVTLENFLETHKLIPECKDVGLKAMVLNFPDVNYGDLYSLTSEMQNIMPTTMFINEKAIGKQIEYAVKEKYNYVIILGQDEIKDDVVVIKNLKEKVETRIKRSELTTYFENLNVKDDSAIKTKKLKLE